MLYNMAVRNAHEMLTLQTCKYVSSYSTPDEDVQSFWYQAAMSPTGLISGGAPPMSPCKSPLTLKGSSRGTAQHGGPPHRAASSLWRASASGFDWS